jgi:hypothetical protein
MPELPEVERARALIAEKALGRRIAEVDDTDTYVCRPHAPGEIAAGLVGRELTEAHRIGKSMWVDTDDGPTLGLHLGMAGRIIVDDEGAGDPCPERPQGPVPVWDRFTLHFEDGGRLILRDKRRLGRAILDPDLSRLGPDAGRDLARRLPRARRPRHRAAEGPDHGPGGPRRRGQPARRRDALASPAVAARAGGRAHRRGARPPAPRAARRDPLGDRQGRRAHRRGDPGAAP